MTGGRQSFGSGGYYESAIDPILPIDMELREEHRKLAVSIALILDRSGSMAASVQGGMGNMTKMNLADEGAARGVDLMGPKDRLAIFAVDSEAHVVVPLTEVRGAKESIATAARSITSAGGGIYVYEGLKAGWEELKKAGGSQKHIILFSDAADSEEPGEWRKLVEEMRKEKATVSVIGLGHENDPDAQLLKDIAKAGDGRIFFVSNALDLPAVFAQETVSVARSTFVDAPVGLASTPLWSGLSSAPLAWPDQIDGYNLNYLKKDASVALFSTDEYKAPLLAFWQRGTGRVGAVSFPLSGDYSGKIRNWNSYGTFAESLARWVMGPDSPPGVGVKTTLKGNTLYVDMYYTEEWQRGFAAHPPTVAIASSTRKDLTPPVWQHLTPGHFQTSLVLDPGELIRGSVLLDKYSLPFGPIGAQKSPEWAFDRERLLEVKEVSKQSGGEERVDLASIWSAPGRVERYNLQPWLLTALLIFFLLECLLSRLNLNMDWPALAFPSPSTWSWRRPSLPSFNPARLLRRRRVVRGAEQGPVADSTVEEIPAPDQITPTPSNSEPTKAKTGLKDSLSRAKRGGK
jgi:Mg-chelatase subunit ChlD